MNKLLLIDGSNLIFRAYYATEKTNIKNPDNIDVNAVYGLINMLDKIIKDEKPTHVFIALDRAKKTFRHKMYEDYKGHRETIPQRLREQFPIIYDLFKAMGIKSGDMEEYEADDLIATYANHGQEQNYFVKIISGDKDLLQLVDEKINVFVPKMGFARECNYDIDTFHEKYEFEPNRFIEYKALVGDSSDNIIGIEKLGDKTAKKLIKNSSNIEEIIQQAEDGEIKGKVGENIKNNKEVIHRNLKLVTLIQDIDLEEKIENLKFEGISKDTYTDFLKQQGFIKIYNKFLSDNDIQKEEKEIKYEKITDFKIDEHIKGTTYIYTQNLKDNYILSENLGIGLVNEAGSYYMALNDVNEEFLLFINSDIPKVFYNLKTLLVNLKIYKARGIETDLYLALALLNPDNYKKAIDQNLISYGVYDIDPFEEVYKAKSNPKKPDEEIIIKDIIIKTTSLKQTEQEILKEIQKDGLSEVLEQIEIPLTLVLAKMELEGINIDLNKLEELKQKYSKEIEKMEEKLKHYTTINFNSFSQLSNLLFEEWSLPKKGIKKTASGYSTDVDNLNKLVYLLNESQEEYEDKIDFITYLLEYRKTSKLLNTYVKNIEKFILDDNKIHPINHQLLAETGRLSVMDPSIQNMPIRTELGQEIRSLFTSKTGTVLAFDYSQIELRVMAHFSSDPNMIEAFNKDEDIHEKTAKSILGAENITPLQRSQAKAINFGIIYGMSAYGLAKQVGISNAAASHFIDTYFEKYPTIKTYMDTQIEKAKETGYVTTLFNRIRKIDNITSKNNKEFTAATRMAINTPIQGSAADIMKMSLIAVNKAIEENELNVKIIMQIHDEIVFDSQEEDNQKAIQIITKAMEEVVNLDVKLRVDYGTGKSWLDAK